MRAPLAVLLAAITLAATPIAARQARDTPPDVIRKMVVAMYSNDVAGYNALTIDHPLRAKLTTGGRVNTEALQRLKEDPGPPQHRRAAARRRPRDAEADAAPSTVPKPRRACLDS